MKCRRMEREREEGGTKEENPELEERLKTREMQRGTRKRRRKVITKAKRKRKMARNVKIENGTRKGREPRRKRET